MAAKTTCASVPVPEKVEHQLEQYGVISDLQSAVEGVEQALYGLRDLAKRPGYEFIGRIVPGYVWAIEQLHELNTGLVDKCESRPEDDRQTG
jgi:hypothetical protein